MRLPILDDTASAGGIAYFVLALGIIGLLYIILNPMVLEFTNTANDMLEWSSVPATQERQDTFAAILGYWYVWPVLALIGYGVYLWKTALEERTGSV